MVGGNCVVVVGIDADGFELFAISRFSDSSELSPVGSAEVGSVTSLTNGVVVVTTPVLSRFWADNVVTVTVTDTGTVSTDAGNRSSLSAQPTEQNSNATALSLINRLTESIFIRVPK